MKILKPEEVIISKIYFIRNQKVMLDKDLAELYGVTTGNLNKAVSRNSKRFPEDFMFKLNDAEFKDLMFQIGISKQGGTRKLPNVFTEHGVTMLSGILNSDRAIEVNVQIVRIFTKLKELALTHKDILLKLEQIESQTINNTKDIQKIFSALKQLLQEPKEKERVKIGYKIEKK